MVAHSYLVWNVDSGATEHIAQDRVRFMEYRRIPAESHDIKVRNGASVEVLGLGTYKLNLRDGGTIFLHNVIYAPEIRRNLLFVVTLLKLSFQIVFENIYVSFYLDHVFYGNVFIQDDFMILDLNYSNINKSIAFLFTSNNLDSYKWHVRLGHIK